jgi:dynamin 1-like protein
MRRPLVLQLVHTPCSNEWGQFLHLDNNPGEIRWEIEQESFCVAGQNKGVSKLLIHLCIHSPNGLNHTHRPPTPHKGAFAAHIRCVTRCF